MDLLHDLLRYHTWATLQVIDLCAAQAPATLAELVLTTDRSIIHTLTHLVGSDHEYLEALAGETYPDPVLAGEILPLDELRRRCLTLAQRWESVLARFEQIDLTLPADGDWPETHHAQNLIVLQTVQHGIDHRTQIFTTLSALGVQVPRIDGWTYWLAEHPR